MPRMAATALVGRKVHFFHIREGAIVHLGVASADIDKLSQLPELVDADGGLNIAQVVFETMRNYLVIPVSISGVAVPGVVTGAVQTQRAHDLCERWPVGGDHASFTGSHVLGGVEAERHCVAGMLVAGARADRPAFILGPGCVCRVFDYVN